MELRVGLETGVEALQVLEAQLLRNGEHFGFIFFDFVETDLVDLAAERSVVVVR